MAVSTYDLMVETLQNLCEVPLNQTDNNFALILPRAFEYADNRIYREMDFLATTVSTVGTAFTIGNGRLAVPTSLIDVMYMNVVTPAATSGDAGTRSPLERVSPEFMDYTWPVATATSGSPSLPSKFAMYGLVSGFSSSGAFTIRVSPAPSTAYVAEFIGPMRPAVLSKTNPDTILTSRYSDLYIAACMVYLMGYQRDFGAQSSDPAAAMSWERTYTTLREGIIAEVERQKSQSSGWSTHTPSMLANQTRDRAPPAPPAQRG